MNVVVVVFANILKLDQNVKNVVIFLNFVLTIVEKQDVTNVVDLQFVLIIVKNQGVKNVEDLKYVLIIV
jgi:hypothetical protein